MMPSIVSRLDLPGALLITPKRFSDVRGYFMETWNRQELLDIGIAMDFVQDNHSMSVQTGTLRGLHFQSPPRSQDKLVRCTKGAIFDVIVDIRKGSPAYAKWLGVELTAENGHQILVPKGFLHGFVTLQPETEVQYKCSDYYSPACDGSVHWDSLGIDWRLRGSPVLSDKDARAFPFDRFESPFVFGENT